MKLKKIFVNLMVALIAVLELKHEDRVPLFDTYPITMVMFCVIFAIHGILLVADELVIQQNANYAGIIFKAKHFSGSHGVVILFLMIIPVLGWSLLVFWVVCSPRLFSKQYTSYAVYC